MREPSYLIFSPLFCLDLYLKIPYFYININSFLFSLPLANLLSQVLAKITLLSGLVSSVANIPGESSSPDRLTPMTKEWIPVTSGLRKLPASSGRSLDPPPDFHSPRFFFHSHCCQVSFLLFCINCLKSLHILSSYPYLFTLLTPCPPYTQVDLGVNKTFLNGKSHSPCFSPLCLINHVNHTFKTPFSLDFCKAPLSHFLSLL